MHKKEKISIVASMKNEEGNVLELYERTIKSIKALHLDYEIILVDNGSTDKTFSLLNDLANKDGGVLIIKLSRDFGHHVGLSAGLDFSSGNYVVLMDGDLQDRPEEIPALYKKFKDGFDVVYGERKNKKFSPIKRILSFFFLKAIKFLVDEPIVINTTIFRIMTKQVVDEVKKLRESQRYLVGLIGWVGFKHTSVNVIHGERKRGKSKYGLLRQFKLAANAIFSFSDYPAKLISRLGFLFVGFSFSMGFYVLIRRIFFKISVTGWSSIIVSLFFIGGVIIFLLGILGEYIGRSYVEIKKRPLYVVDKTLNNKKGKL